MRLTVVGASGSIGGPESPASCYLVQAPYEGATFAVLLDLGPGALGVLHRFLDPAELDAVLLSHLHPDHCLDLCGLYVEATYSSWAGSATAPWPAIDVHGPSGAAERIARAYAATSAEVDGPGPGRHFRFRTWSAEQTIGPFRVRTARVAHPVQAYAIRLEEVATGATLVFSGDTGPSPALVDLARDADLLLCEAAFLDRPDNPAGVHLSGREAGEHAERAGVRRLVLTHIPPWHLPADVLAEAQPAFPGPVELARTGACWTLP
ncbi:MAG: MBL fold metallo-hydrolase [Propionibacteriaceae bacterium]